MKNLTLRSRGFIMAGIGSQNSDSKPVCNIPLCGRDADWEVELFGKVEYYCMRHKPGVPEQFMTKVKPVATATKAISPA
jgi:hypothetical protein